MDRSYLPRLTTANSDRVLLALTQHQHLHPAHSVGEMVQTVCRSQGFAAAVGDRALHELAIPAQTRAGRLSRQHLCDLAQTMESAWQTTLGTRARAPEDQ